MNTNVNYGQLNSASTVPSCQSACVSDIQCTGFDYVPTATQGQRCWLSGPWSGTRNNGTKQGVTHYDINRSCTGIIYYVGGSYFLPSRVYVVNRVATCPLATNNHNRLWIVRCYSFDHSVVSIGAVGGRRWVGVDRVTCVGGGAYKYDACNPCI